MLPADGLAVGAAFAIQFRLRSMAARMSTRQAAALQAGDIGFEVDWSPSSWPSFRGSGQLLRIRSHLEQQEATTLMRIEQHKGVARARVLAQELQAIVRQYKPEILDAWLTASRESGIAELHSFAAGLQQEYLSIRAALSDTWSTGQVEGKSTRVKGVRRQIYGRAKFDLLKQRVVQRA